MMASDTTVVQKFYELSAEAERINSESFDELVEPAFEALLFHVMSHPESKQQFVNAFLQLACSPDKGPPELIQYCMHALRWEEVKRELINRLEFEGSERVKHILRKLIMSFDDGWYDADAYARFSGKN